MEICWENNPKKGELLKHAPEGIPLEIHIVSLWLFNVGNWKITNMYCKSSFLSLK
jgi:hypothetical protein